MSKATDVANQLVDAATGGLEELRVHVFEDDESAHDDELAERLYAEFSAEFDLVQTERSVLYGAPARTRAEDDGAIPLGGFFRCAIWSARSRQLFAAAAHEDRGAPILLMLGAADRNA